MKNLRDLMSGCPRAARTARRLTTAALLAAALSSPTYGLVWTGLHPTSSDWDALGPTPMGPRYRNWEGNPGTLPVGPSLLVEFGNGQAGGGFGSGNPTLNGDRTIGSIDINHTGNQFLIANTLDTLTLATGDITRDSMSTGTHVIGSRISLGSSGTWNIAGSGGLSIANTITGTDTLTKTGDGVLSLGVANPFSGTADINNGTVILAHANALQNATVNLNKDDVLDITTNTLDANLGALGGTGDLDIGAQTLTFGSNNQDTTYSGALTGSGNINKTGTGSFTLNGPGHPSGTVNINDGKIVLLSGVALDNSTVSININDGLDVTTNAVDADLGALTGTGNLDIGGQLLIVGRNDTSTTYDGVLDGTGVIQKKGSGSLTLTAANTFSGNAVASEGKFLLAHADALQNANAAILIDNGLDITTNTLDANLGGLGGTGALDIGAQTLTVGSNNATTTYDGILSGTGLLIKTGTGVLSLGAANPFSGTADINAGTVILAHADALQNATVNLNDDNVLDITTNLLDANLGALGGAGALDIGAQTLTVGSNNATTTYDGILSGTGLLIKTGTGDLVLTQNNTHGGTRVNGGVLEIDNDNQFGSTETNLTLDTGEVRFSDHITTSNTRDLVIEAGNGTVNTNGFNVTWDGNIEGSGILIKTGEKDLELTNSSDHAGITIEGGSVTIERDNYIGGSGAVLTLDGGELRYLDVIYGIFTKDTVIEAGGGTVNIVSASDELNWNSQITGSGTLTKTGNGVLALADDNTHAATVVEGGILEISNDNQLGTSGADLTLDGGELRLADNIDTENTRELILGSNNGTFNTNGFDATWNGLVSDENSLTKIGDGTLTLTAANAFSGGLIIDGGTVSLANSSAAGTGAITVLGSTIDYVDGVNISNTIDLQNDVTLNIDTGTATQSGVIGETGGPFGISKTGAGNLTLSAANTFTGTADIDDGTLVLGHADALLNNTVSINSDNGLDVTTNLINANLGGLAGSGALDIGAQTLTVGSNDASTTFTDGGGGGLQGTGTLVKTGTGTLELAGSHSSFNGAITVAGGALTMNAVDMQVAALDVQAGNNLVLNTGATLRDQADLTLDAAVVDIDASTFDMSGVDATDSTGATAGQTLTLDSGAQLEATNASLINLRGGNGFEGTTSKGGATGGSLVITNGDVDLSTGALVDLIGGHGARATSAGPKTGGTGGSVVLTNGSLTMDPTAVIDLRGGFGVAPSEAASIADASSPVSSDAALLSVNLVGNVGSFTITGGTADLQGDIHLSGRDAIIDGISNAKDGGTLDISGGGVTISGTADLSGGVALPDVNSDAGNGGTLLVSGGTTELTGTVLLDGPDGGNGVDTGQEGGNAGDGGSVDVSGGTLTLNTGALIDLSAGFGGTGTTTNGVDGTPGSVSVTGGTLELNAGLITGDNTATPSADPINIIQTDLTVNTTGTVRVNDDMTIDNATLNVDAATFDASGTDGSTPTDGKNLTVNGAGSIVNLTGTALIDLDGGDDTGSGNGANAGSLVFNNGSLTVAANATIQARGGTSGFHLDNPGLSGSATFNGGIADIQGTLNIKGRDGKNGVDDIDNGQLGSDGGSVTIGGTADVTITGELSIQGGKGGNSGFGSAFSSPDGGNGGDGGTLTVQAGTLTTDSAAAVKLQGGNGGNGDGSSGNGGDGGQLLVQGGTVNIQGGSTFTMQGGRAGSDESSSSSGDGGQIVVEGGVVTIHDGSTFDMTGADGSSGDLGGDAGHGGQLLILGGDTTISVAMEMTGGQGSDDNNLFGPEPGDGGNGGVIAVSGGTLTLNTGAFFDMTPGLGGADGGIDGAPATVSVTGGGSLTINGATITGDTTFVPTNADPIQIHNTTITLGVPVMALTADAATEHGSLVLTEDTTIDNTTVDILDTGVFDLASGITLTAQNSSAINADISLLISADAAAPFDTTTVNILSGSTLATAGQLEIGTGDGGTLLVDGPGSSLTTDTGIAGISNWGGSGGVATVTVSDQATADVGQLRLAHTGAGSATLTVQSDADMTSRQLNIATGGLASATAAVTGTGSTYTQIGASSLNVGGSGVGTGTGTLNVADSALFTTATGVTTVNQRGTINVLTGATFDANADITIDAGTLTVDNATLIADGIPDTSDPADAHTLNVTNGGVVDLLGTAEVSMDGDGPDSSISTTGFGGVINLDGTLNVGPDALLTLNALDASTDRWHGGSGGQINITGGTANLDGTVRLNAADGDGSGIFGAYGDGGDGGTITVTGGTLNQASTGTLTARAGSGATLGTPGGITVDGGTADLAGSIDLSGRLGQPGISALAFGPTAGSSGGSLTVVSGTATVSGSVSLAGGNGGVGVDAQDGEDGGDGGDVVVDGGMLTLNTPASINLTPGTGGDPGPSGGSAGADGSAGVVRVFSGATLDINGASIFVDTGDTTLAKAIDPITITNATVEVGQQDFTDGGTLNLNDDTTLDNATLNRADIGTVNLAATKTLSAINGSTIDYDNDTTIGTDQTYDINTASTFIHEGHLTLDDGALILNDATLDADGNTFDPGPQIVQGFNLTLNGTGALLDVQTTAVVDLSGGDSEGFLNDGQLGGSLMVNGGTFNLDTPATLDLDGGDGIGGGQPGGNGGSGGVLSVADGSVTLNGTANLRGRDGEDTSSAGSNDGGDAGSLTVSGGSTTLAGSMNLTGGKGGNITTLGSTGGDGGDGGTVPVTGGTLTLNTPASINLSPGLGGTGAMTDGADGAPGAVRIFSGATLNINGASIFVDTGDTALAKAIDPITITNATIDVGIQDTNDGGTLNLNDDTTLDNATLNRAHVGDVNLAATKTLSATNGSTIDYDNDTTIGTDQTYNFNASTFRHNGNLTLDDGALILNGTTLDADGNFFNPAPKSVPGFTLTLNGPSALLDVQATSVIDLSGGDPNFSTVNHGQLGGLLIVNDGTFNLDTPATLDLDGGSGTGSSEIGGVGGSGGALTVADGSVTLNGTANLRGQDGEDISSSSIGSNHGGDAGTFNVQGGSTTLAGAMNLTGGNGGDNSFFSAVTGGNTGGDGGNGGLVDVSGGTLTLDTGASIDLTPGLGGTGYSANGADGTPGTVDISGGTLALNAGLATANNTLIPIGDTTEIVALVINLSVGVIDASATSTTLSHASTLNITGGAATFDTLTIDGSSTLDNNGGTTTVNTAINLNHGTINGPVGGTATLTKSTPNPATLSGTEPNTYTGLTTVNDGDLDFVKSAGANAIGGNLTINGGDVWLHNNDQIPDIATVTVNAGAFRLFGNDETFTNLVLNAPGQTHLGGGNLTTDTLSGDGKIFFASLTNTNGYTVNQGDFAGETTGRGHLIKETPGSLTFSGTTDPAGQIFFDVNNGTLHLDGANLQSGDDAITVASGATLSGTAVTAAGVNVAIQSGGTFTPGNSPGIFNVGGDLILAPTATLQIEVADAVVPIGGSDHDLVNVTGGVTLGGTLEVVALPDDATFEATELGTEYHVMTYDMRTAASMFDTITGTRFPTNTAFALAPLFKNVTSLPDDPDDTLILRATIPGDLNLDNTVSVADLATFALNFDTTPGLYDEAQQLSSWELGDFNTDGAITVSDLSLLALNFGFDASDPSSAALGLSIHDVALMAGIDPSTIPEPTMIWLVGAGVLLLPKRRF